MIKSIFILFLALISLMASVEAQSVVSKKPTAVIGVLAFRSKAETLQEWQPLADYLNTQITTHSFTIRPLSYAEFNDAAKANELDFMFTNPEHYIYLSTKYDATRIATLIRANIGGKELAEFGGVIIARSNRSDLKELNDIKGKRVAAVDQLSLGGYLAQLKLLDDNGINIVDESTISFVDMPHDKVVYSVERGASDIGFIRTGVLEKMAKEGKIKREDFKIIHPVDNFPLALSTTLYPEWPFASTKKTNHTLANKVVVALLKLPYGSDITKKAGYYGWSIPLSYEGIRTMMQELRVKPYDTLPRFSLHDVITRYGLYIILSLSMVIILLIFLVAKMRQLTNRLHFKSVSLENQVQLVQAHEKSLRRAAGVFHNSREGIVITDTKKYIIEVNEAFCEVTGYAREEVIGQKPVLLRSGIHEKEFYNKLDQAIRVNASWRGEIWNKKKSGELYAEFLRIDAIRDKDGNVENYIGIFSDITEHKIRQEQLHHMANYDPLTNLPNRHLFLTLAEQILSFSKRNKTKAVISFLDLDGFKNINDTHGHDAGDNLLRQVSHRLEKELRQSDAIARIGGDEFVIIFSDIASIKDVHPLFERILKALQEPFSVNGKLMSIGVSIGAAFYPDHGEEIEILVRHADAAMYRSKENGRNQITYFDQEKMGSEMV